MSKHYNKVKKWFDMGMWSIEVVKSAVKKGWITKDEFKEITGEEYDNG
jgi:uncharacterized XkdX family phage protein